MVVHIDVYPRFPRRKAPRWVAYGSEKIKLPLTLKPHKSWYPESVPMRRYHDKPEALKDLLLGKQTGLGWILHIEVTPEAYVLTGSLQTVRFIRHEFSQATIEIIIFA